MQQNFWVGILELISAVVFTYLVLKIHPLRLLKIRLFIFSLFALIIPVILTNITTPFQLFLLQVFIGICAPTGSTAFAIFCMNFPVFKRFLYTGVIFATSRAIMYALALFGSVFLTDYFSYWGLLIIISPVLIGYGFGINHFKKLEVNAGNYY